MIIKHSNGDINQSVQQHIAICHPMAGSRTYIGPVYYNSRQPVTWAHNGIITIGPYCTAQGIIQQIGELRVTLIILVCLPS